MGGVPFKSTGCNTCRRRKVKCDETKPECRRCTKNGHVCTGYERDRVFIHKSSTSMVKGSQRLAHRPCTLSQTASARQRGRVEPDIPRLNTSVEVRSQLLQSFLEWYMPPSEYVQDATGRGLLETLPDIAGSSRLLDKAIASLSTAFLAQQNKDQHLLQYSTKLYGDAIQTLNRKMRIGEDIGKDILYTTIIFQFYEMINCSPLGLSAWIAHVQGSNAVVKQYVGREDQPAAERLFHRQIKFSIICNAIGNRKAACLYRTLAWDHRSSQGKANRDHVDEIMNKLVELTALVEQVDSWCAQYKFRSSKQVADMGKELLAECFSMENELHIIFLEMQETLGAASPLPSDYTFWKGFRSALATDLFCEPLQYPSMTCAECHLFYWTALILLYPLIDQLLTSLDDPGDCNNLSSLYNPDSHQMDIYKAPIDAVGFPTNPSDVDFTALAEHYANEICRSVMYTIQPAMKTLGAQFLLAPLNQSAQFFYVRDMTAKYQWCQRVFGLLPQLGLTIGYFLKDLVWPKYCSSHRHLSCSTEPGLSLSG